MTLKYDTLNLKLESVTRLQNLYHYLKFAYGKPRRVYRLIPVNPPYLEEMIYDLATDRFLGTWDEDCFDFAGADDEVVERLDAVFRKHIPVQAQN